MKCIQKNLLAACLIIAVLALGSSSAFAGLFVSIGIAPPPLPFYEQPACPYDGYIWTPGYWAYGDYGYYWVPGTWVQPPEFGLFWTPCYWGWGGNAYSFHSGYWGQNVGFYGGINYGYGYGGNGYSGGRWQGGHFSYNTAVNNVSPSNVHHTYADRSAVNASTGNVSYNGGNGGVQAQPTAQQRQFSSERHTQATSVQQAYVRAASQDRGQLASANGGTPATLTAARPQAYTGLAQEHAKAQPLTRQDRTTAQQAVSKSGTQASSNPQIKAEKQTGLASQKTAATVSHKAAVKAPAHSVAHAALPSHAVAHVAAPSHAVAHVAPQSHAVAHVAPASHAVAHAAPPSHPASHAAPPSHSVTHAKA